ncbi:putative DNA helicase [Campylobacter phage F372]|uniref:Putative DNA helicase n=1 Tax=Campylobacter phage F372 TaxID=2794375 RepID=A0A7T3KHK1_9CAUD|nr:putative DNA helicase [Campylobacter phage F372]
MISGLILKNLINDEIYFDKVYSILKPEHFIGVDSDIYKTIQKLVKEYNKKPTPKEVALKLKDNFKDEQQENCINRFKEIMLDKQNVSPEFLNNETAEFIKQAEMRSCIIQGAKLIQEKKDIGKIYERLGQAISFTMDTDIGMKDIDAQERDILRRETKIGISTGVEILDEVLAGGYMPSTLNFICSVTHGGKSMFLSHFCANAMLKGYNCLYITLEMPSIKIWDRIESNIFNIDISELRNYNVSEGYKSLPNLGRCVVKEYGAGSFDVLQLKSLVQKVESSLEISLNCIIIDYLALMASYALQPSVGLYSYYKKIAEELHAYAKESKKCVLSAAQLNRNAYNNSNADTSTIAESLGIAQTADTIAMLHRSPELDELGQAIVSFTKNRNSGNLSQKYIGINFKQSRFFDIDQPD